MTIDDQGSQSSRRLTRRQVVGAGAGAAGALAIGGLGAVRVLGGDDRGGPVDAVLRARPETVELGSRRAATWSYDGTLPGRELRLRQGRPVRIRLENDLPEPTSIHWHGIRLRNEADGVPDFTQDAVEPGDSFVYEFTPPDAGTYFFHSHVGMQLDRGLYAPLIVEAASEELSYDREAVLVLDDWLDGVAGTPDRQLADLRRSGMDMGAGSMGSGEVAGDGMTGVHTTLTGAAPDLDHLAQLANLMERGEVDPGDVRHPLYLVNGHPPEDPDQLRVRRGDRVRLRLVNAAADTIFCFFVEGLPMTITHADGLPVEPVATDALVLGMGERYDVLLDARGDGARRVLAMPLGKPGRAVGVVRLDGSGESAPPASAPVRSPKRIASYADLRDPERPGPLAGARVSRLDLAMRMPYVWTIGGQAFPEADVIEASLGEPQRFVMRNDTMMPHPMHLHGHSFRPAGGGPLKDTILVLPRREVAVEWIADNPGEWAFHCHNAYHQEAGMMRKVEVA